MNPLAHLVAQTVHPRAMAQPQKAKPTPRRPRPIVEPSILRWGPRIELLAIVGLKPKQMAEHLDLTPGSIRVIFSRYRNARKRGLITDFPPTEQPGQ